MANVIRTRLIKIGNSQGVRIPKIILDQLHMTDTIEIEVLENQLIVRSSNIPRADWATAFEAMAANGDDQLLDADASLTSWDETEWEW